MWASQKKKNLMHFHHHYLVLPLAAQNPTEAENLTKKFTNEKVKGENCANNKSIKWKQAALIEIQLASI